MKKHIILLTALVISAGLTACGGASEIFEVPQEIQEQHEQAEQPQETPTEETTIKTTEAETSETVPDADNSNAPSIVLAHGSLDEYSKEITLNAGTSEEATYIGYFIPAGTYTVTNIGKYMDQVTVYADGIQKNDAGWEEPITDGVPRPIVLDVDQSGEITIGENQYVKLGENSLLKFVAK